MKFIERTTAPSKEDAHFYKNNPFYQCNYGMPNCTCYAWGRFYEQLERAGLGKPKLSLSNAENWYDYNDGYARGQKAKLGAVICYRKGQAHNENDGAGHVAIVEKINADGSIVISNSAWGGSNFYTKTIPSNYKYSDYQTFQGFIYLPFEYESSKSIDELAHEVINGVYGNGDNRKKALGSQYEEVQARVNQLLNKPKLKTIDEIAREVIKGKWGNGEYRRNELTKAGYNYKEVQARVNQLLK